MSESSFNSFKNCSGFRPLWGGAIGSNIGVLYTSDTSRKAYFLIRDTASETNPWDVEDLEDDEGDFICAEVEVKQIRPQ